MPTEWRDPIANFYFKEGKSFGNNRPAGNDALRIVAFTTENGRNDFTLVRQSQRRGPRLTATRHARSGCDIGMLRDDANLEDGLIGKATIGITKPGTDQANECRGTENRLFGCERVIHPNDRLARVRQCVIFFTD
jgi:hypothetical protein